MPLWHKLSLDRSRGALVLAVAVAAGLGIGFLLVPRAPTPGDAKEPPPKVLLLGEPLALDDEAPKRALDRVRRFAAGKLTLDLGDGQKRELPFGRLGAEIDKVRLSQLVRDCRDATSPLRMARRGRAGDVTLPVPIVLDTGAAVAVLLRLKDELDRLPVDARLDLEKRSLVPEVSGRLLDVDATLAALRAAVATGEAQASAVFEARPPRRAAAQLGEVKFDAVLGWFETKYNRGDKYQARTFNLRLAASKLDGTVLLPGEVFDFNEVVGSRDEANGYKVAPVIAEGELVDGIGGGTCQILGHAARRRVLRRPRRRRALPAHAAQLVHQDGARRDGGVPDHQLPGEERLRLPRGAAPDGEERRGARRGAGPAARAHRDPDPSHRQRHSL